MKTQTRFFALLLLCGTLALSVGIGSIMLLAHANQQPGPRISGMGQPAALSQAVLHPQEDTPPIDSRPCRAQPSAQNCDGVLPFAPHFSPLSHDLGSGACFDGQRQLMESQELTDSQQHVIGTFQLWFFPRCQSYTAHLIFAPDAPQKSTIEVEVDQFDTNWWDTALPRLLWAVGSEDPLFPIFIEHTGPIKETEIWSPLLYSPTETVQASAQIEDAHGNPQAAITQYYAAGHPTTINGNSV